MTNAFLVQVCSALGFLISLYFVLIYRGIVKGSKTLVPEEVCSEKKCSSLLKTVFARALGVPNFYLGVLYYVLIFSATFTPYLSHPLFLILAWWVLAFSVYLAFALMFRLKTACWLCYASHLLNIVIALSLAT